MSFGGKSIMCVKSVTDRGTEGHDEIIIGCEVRFQVPRTFHSPGKKESLSILYGNFFNYSRWLKEFSNLLEISPSAPQTTVQHETTACSTLTNNQCRQNIHSTKWLQHISLSFETGTDFRKLSPGGSLMLNPM